MTSIQTEFDLDPSRFREQLKRWYTKHARELPWRETENPYHIWISEIMLQQTTVKAVVPYFERFLARFPTVLTLANAEEAEVLQLWEGLGYYSRGRNILKAAKVIVSDHNGEFPSSLKELEALPGIGRYTAGAICSFGFNKPAPIVEANTLRLYARLIGYADDPRSTIGQKNLWAFAEFIQPQRTAGTLNQSLMELGSLVCTPNEPDCPNCPVKTDCTAFTTNRQHEIPQKKPRPVITPLLEATVAIQHSDKYLLRQRTEQERWAGLWDFPRFELETKDPTAKLTQSLLHKLTIQTDKEISQQTGFNLQPLTFETEIKHSVTRYRIRLLCFSTTITADDTGILPAGWQACTLSEINELPMPVSGRKFAKKLPKRPST